MLELKNITKTFGSVVANKDVSIKIEKGTIHATTSAFFQQKAFGSESELRDDAHKWETVLNQKHNFRGTSLSDPCFDIYYHAREESQATTDADKIRYALIVTVRSAATADLYNQILQRFATLLTPLRPVIAIPIRTSG